VYACQDQNCAFAAPGVQEKGGASYPARKELACPLFSTHPALICSGLNALA
jgi:hypothetical protein